jgi:tetratricopeptide (TPR) repeat protein
MKWALCALALIACAHRTGSSSQRVDFAEGDVIVAGEPDPFEAGTQAFKTGDFATAARDFDKARSWWNAALAYDRLENYDVALERWQRYLRQSDEIDAQFHAAYDEHELHQIDAAERRLRAVLQRSDLKATDKASALLQIGVCEIESGKRADGELLIRQAMELYGKEQVDPSLPAQAEFWLGEAYRGTFRESALDPSTMDEKQLGDALETKAQFLLSAQGHYLRCIRKGDGEWATAAGFRLGEMYEALHDELVNAPLPRNLTDAQRDIYKEELRKRVRTLVEKAVRIYEQTLSNAQETGAQNAYRQKTQDALERLRKLLL